MSVRINLVFLKAITTGFEMSILLLDTMDSLASKLFV